MARATGVISILLLVFLVTGCRRRSPHGNGPEAGGDCGRSITWAESHAGPDGVRILRAAEAVEPFLLDPERRGVCIAISQDSDGKNTSLDSRSELAETYAGRIVIGRGSRQGREFAQRLAAVLLNDGTYPSDHMTGRGGTFDASPEIGFRILAGKEALTVVVSLDDGALGYSVQDESRKPAITTVDCEPGVHALRMLASECFPDEVRFQNPAYGEDPGEHEPRHPAREQVPGRTYRILKQAVTLSLLHRADPSAPALTPSELRLQVEVAGVALDVDGGYDFAVMLDNDALFSPPQPATAPDPSAWKPDYGLLATSDEGQTLILWDSISDRLAFLDPAAPPPTEIPALDFSRGRAAIVQFLKFSLMKDAATRKLDSTLRFKEPIAQDKALPRR